MRREAVAVGVRDTPLMVALRWVEWDYGRDGWHGDESVDPALYALHYRTAKRHSIEARRLPVVERTWDRGPVIALKALCIAVEAVGTASFVTGYGNSWCGLALAYEAWATDSRDPGWRDLPPREHPCRFTTRGIIGVLAEDLAVVTLGRDERDDSVKFVEGTGPMSHALTMAVSTIDYQRQLDPR